LIRNEESPLKEDADPGKALFDMTGDDEAQAKGGIE
jgi:hypothetical protein